MTRWLTPFPALVLAFLASPALPSTGAAEATLAFGSCLRQWQPQPVWETITALSPRAFIFAGDNVYTDTGPYRGEPEPARIEKAYNDLAATESFGRFRTRAQENGTALLATWDDHDYGRNDAGGDYPHRLASKEHFLDFFGLERTASGDAGEPGVYHSRHLKAAGLDVQVILLDTRSFRAPLPKTGNTAGCPYPAATADDARGTVLGAAQWQWLERQLRQPADLRLLVSSIQVLPTEHCFEKWANFPAERQRLLSLIGDTGADRVVILSGDRHLGEISRLTPDAIGYPLHEITSSGLNSAMTRLSPARGESNPLRIAGENVLKDNFGTLHVERDGDSVALKLQLRAADGEVLRQVSLPLDQLSAAGGED